MRWNEVRAAEATVRSTIVAAVCLLGWAGPAAGQNPAAACPAGRVATGLAGELSFGGSLIRSSTDENKATGTLSATYYPGRGPCTVPRWRTLLQLQGDYGDKAKSDAPKNVTRNYRGDLQQMRLFGPGSRFIAAAARLRHNNTQGIDLQQLYSVTAGVVLSALGGLELAAGPGWSRIRFADSTSVSFAGMSLAETGSVVLPLGRVSPVLTQGVRVFLPLEEAGHTRVEALGAVIIALTGRLDLAWNLWLDYLDDAPPRFEDRYLNTALTLRISF